MAARRCEPRPATTLSVKRNEKLVLLSLLALAQGLPYEASSRSLSPHHLCPEDQSHFLLPHEYDCTLFYYCEYGMRYDEPTSCALGTEFSAELQICIHPALANCHLSGVPPAEEVDNENESGENKPGLPESVEQTPDIEEENLESEEQKPEVEEQEPDLTETTPKSLEENTKSEEQKLESQELSPEVEEEESVNVESQSESEEAEEEEEGSKVESEEQQLEVEEQKPKPPQDWLPNGCPADIHVHWLLPHETECNKFYHCNFGEKVLTTCASGTYFNFEMQVCDWPENVNCTNINGSGDSEDGSGDNEDGSGDNEDGSTDNGNGSGDNEDGSDDSDGSGDNESGSGESDGNGDSGDGWLSNGCPENSDVHHLLPHETECGKFYQCVHEEKVERQCGGELQFNPILQVCDYPENVGCQGTDNGDNSDEHNVNSEENNENSEEEEDSNESNGESHENSKPELANGCPSDFNIHQLLPHESDCSKFYYCNFGNKIEQLCPSGLHFSPELQVCDWPWNVNCKNSNSSIEDNHSGANNEDSDENNNSSGIDNSNSKENNGGVENSESEENENDSNEEDHGLLPNGCPADFNVNHLLSHESDCGKFYYCVSGEKVESACGGGLHFNPVLQVCDWPENVNCSNNGTSAENNGFSQEIDNKSEENNVNSEESNSNKEENQSSSGEDTGNGEDTEDTPDNSKCADSCNTKPWTHAFACDKFWRCEGKTATLITCSEGLFFNPNTGTCDFMCNVNCVRQHVQTTANAQGLKIFVPWNKVDDTIRESYMPLSKNSSK